MTQEDAREGSEAVLCRCEGVTCAEVIEAFQSLRPTSLRELKLVTRVGMGICQGRVCRPAFEGLGETLGLRPEPAQLPYRTPLRAVRLGAFADAGGREAE